MLERERETKGDTEPRQRDGEERRSIDSSNSLPPLSLVHVCVPQQEGRESERKEEKKTSEQEKKGEAKFLLIPSVGSSILFCSLFEYFQDFASRSV